MLTYKPKFCCECGEKIERAGGELLPSRRFCDVCAKDFEPKNRIWKGAAAIAIFMIGGLSSYSIQPTPKPVTVTTAQAVVSNAPTPQPTTAKNQPPAPAPTAPTPQPPTVKPIAPPFVAAAPEEPVYYCGARTQKGAPCTRRVKGGGRCWQHKDKPAMMPDEKLLIR